MHGGTRFSIICETNKKKKESFAEDEFREVK